MGGWVVVVPSNYFWPQPNYIFGCFVVRVVVGLWQIWQTWYRLTYFTKYTSRYNAYNHEFHHDESYSEAWQPTDQPKYRGNFPWTSTLIVNYGFVKNKHVAIYKILLDSCFGRKNPQRSEVISYEGPKFRGFKKKAECWTFVIQVVRNIGCDCDSLQLHRTK